MFAFNFDVDGEEIQTNPPTLIAPLPIDSNDLFTNPSMQVHPIHPVYSVVIEKHGSMLKRSFQDALFQLAVEDEIRESEESEGAIQLALEERSDLIKGIYEGGLKIWEASDDLLSYLNQHPELFHNHSILEIGCGAGLCGIFCLTNGASKLCFQDYNEQVLQLNTIPNVLMNLQSISFSDEYYEAELDSSLLNDNVSFWSGDWKKFTNMVVDQFDLILSSECLYNPDNYPKLKFLLDKLLSDTGVALFATKTYYFGCGGGSQLFKSFLEGYQVISIVQSVGNNAVQREILKVTRAKYE